MRQKFYAIKPSPSSASEKTNYQLNISFNMTPKKKAIQLTRQMYKSGSNDSCEVYRENAATRCALIAVDEIIASIPTLPNDNSSLEKTTAVMYWVEVKNEINKL